MKKSINRKFNENGQVIEEQIVEEGFEFKNPFKKEKKNVEVTDEYGNVISVEEEKKSVVGKVAAAAGIGLAVLGSIAFGVSKSKKKNETPEPVINYNYYLPTEDSATSTPVDTATETETTELVAEDDEVNVTEF